MLLETAIGDAYGACFEGCDLDFIQKHNNLNYNSSYEMPSLVPAGCYTDDTQMTLALAELLLDDVPFTKENVANKFVEVFHRNQRRGYTTAFLLLLMNSYSGKELLSKINGNSTKNGAAMRAGPIGLIKNLEELEEKSNIQANVTHCTMEGKKSALCVSLAVHYFYYFLGPKSELINWLEKKIGKINWWEIGDKVSVEGLPCVHAALHCVNLNDNLSDILKQCISYGGDTDTTAAIAMAISSCSEEINKNLPNSLINNLENKIYGKDYLILLDNKLKQKFLN